VEFKPEDMEAVQSCLEGIDRNLPVTVEPAAARLLMSNSVRMVADILALRNGPLSSSGPWGNVGADGGYTDDGRDGG
jgi:hypothetical protein